MSCAKDEVVVGGEDTQPRGDEALQAGHLL